ncbi:FAD:protein FMN transferase [Rugamonas brunnea]|uniref:FAD:protein FMN transferase n=1 Tax=Rugamonas brunnea TaxID=2758569 RepID=UPI002882DABE|nr:FAD:protein FMN transferase [Rugamonas brunnea]
MVKTSSELSPEQPERYSLNGETMGTRYTALFYGPPGLDRAAIHASLFAAVDQVDRQMSNWNPDSDLCRLNAAPAHAWLAVPAELAQVLATGLRISLQSDGAFEMGVGDLVARWGFGPAQRQPTTTGMAPPPAVFTPATTALEVDLGRLRVRKHAPLALDLCGIAKGYGVDKLAHCLDGWGIDRYLVGIDGEMRARGTKPDGAPWAVALEKPTYGTREVAGVMELEDMAIATSGDYRHWVDVDGTRYGHTMDPAQGRPLSNGLAAVTVLSSTCMLADAWATALMVLGPVEGVALARQRGMDALFVLRDGDGLRETLILAGELAQPA